MGPASLANSEISIIIAAVEADKLGLVAAADQLEAAFNRHGLLYESQISSRQVFETAS